MKHERIHYPDGQISVKFTEVAENGVITFRINSYEDLYALRALSSVLPVKTELIIPCLFGQRSDRKFADNQSFDLKLICNDINSFGFSKVGIFDPHSDVSLALIDNSYKISSLNWVRHAVNSIQAEGNLILVSPDAGAYKKVFEYGEKLELPVVAAVKHRDLDGKIDLTFMGDVKDKICLIVDDLCDGGYTFIQLGKKLKEQGAKKVFLYVSHAFFSKGYSELHQVLDGVYCTNSVKDIDMTYFDSYKVRHLEGWLKQFKFVE